MRTSLLIVFFFIVGVLGAWLQLFPAFFQQNDLSLYALYVLMFLVGVSIGGDTQALKVLMKSPLKLFLVPFLVMVGSLLGTALLSLGFSDVSMREGMAVGAGFGYYSLSSVFISRLHGEELGTIALASNIIREIITLLFAPLLVIVFGKLAPIASGGATAMDTTLPVIARYSGKEFAVVAVFSGVVLTLVVPFLVTLILSF